MNVKEIQQFIIANPNVGRRQLSKMFNISERQAIQIKKDILPNLFNEKQITSKDVAKYLGNMGLSEKQVIDLLTPKNYAPRNIGDTSMKEFSIGIIGDTHLSDRGCAIDELHDFYNKCKSIGVQHIVHAGDFTSGGGVYKGMEYDLLCHGYTEQLIWAEKNYPKVEGITTHAISGNHDLSFKQSNGAHFMSALSDRRDDIKWIGDYAATVNINGVSVKCHHGDGGVGFTASYRLQRNIEAFESGCKPQIYVLGHYHRALAMFVRNVHAYMPGCWQRPNDYSIRKALPNLICGYIIHIKTLNDEMNSIRSISSELIAYY